MIFKSSFSFNVFFYRNLNELCLIISFQSSFYDLSSCYLLLHKHFFVFHALQKVSFKKYKKLENLYFYIKMKTNNNKINLNQMMILMLQYSEHDLLI